MILVDTSTLRAIVLGEPTAAACRGALETETRILISAAAMAEALIVAGRRNVGAEMTRLPDVMAVEVVPVTETAARQVGNIYQHWGKGVHPATLNFGDTFAYDTAKTFGCPLLFVGHDFSLTDVETDGV